MKGQLLLALVLISSAFARPQAWTDPFMPGTGDGESSLAKVVGSGDISESQFITEKVSFGNSRPFGEPE